MSAGERGPLSSQIEIVFPPLYAIIDAGLLKTSELSFAEMMAESGVEILQYRSKHATSRQLFEICSLLAREWPHRFIVNDRPDIASLVGAAGVHVGQNDLGVEEARAIVGPQGWVGVSTHNLGQAVAADQTSADYIAIGPIFATTTKAEPDPVVGLDLLAEVRRRTRKPLVAIGGITLERAESVYRAGADSLAVTRDLMAATDPVQQARAFLQIAARVKANQAWRAVFPMSDQLRDTPKESPTTASTDSGFVRSMGLFDSTTMVVGSMIGSGIFIVSADIARQTGSTGGLLAAWIITGVLTVAAALSYGELAAMMPKAGGQYVYLRESYSPLWGFLYGWTLFLVIQTGTIAAVAVAFARYLGVLAPSVSPVSWIIPPIDLSSKYALSLSRQQFVAILLIVFLTAANTRGIRLGKLIQNVFTSAKTLALAALILLGLLVGWNAAAVDANFSNIWANQGALTIQPGADFLRGLIPVVSVAAGAFGIMVAFGVAQVGSLFSADAWNNITFTAGEVKNPQRNVPLSLALGTGIVIALYLLANVAYLVTLPLTQIQSAPDDRVATAVVSAIFGSAGAGLMAAAIMISTFGCNNGLILAGARVYYAMSRDGLFFRSIGQLNSRHVPAKALVLQGVWASILVLARTRLVRDDGSVTYGNLYGDLLDYVVFAVLIFYVLTIYGLFVLRRKRPDAPRPYRAFGYPLVPILYIVLAVAIMIVLILYKTQTTWPGLLIVLLGVPVYLIWSRRAGAAGSSG